MADFFTQRFLDSCGLSDYQVTFRESNVNLELLRKLSLVDLLELVPDAALRRQFVTKWEATFGEKIPEVRIVELIDLQNLNFENLNLDVQPPSLYATKDSLFSYVSKESLHALLNADPLGRSLLGKYARTNVLEPLEADYVIKIIMPELLKKNLTDWENSHWERASHNLAGPTGIFVTESPLTYYTPASSGGVVSGKLPNAYRNRTSLIRIKNGTARSRKRKAEVLEEPVVETQPADVKTSIKWLKENEAPVEDVVPHWRITSKFRQQSIAAHKGGNIQWLIDTYSALKNAEIAGKLVQVDYEEQFGGLEITASKFDSFWKAIRTAPSGKQDHRGILEDLADLETSSEDTRVLAQLCLMAYHYPPKTNSYKKKDAVEIEKEQKSQKGSKSIKKCASETTCNRFSSPVAEESMVQFIEDAADIASVKELVIKQHKDKPVQPYVLVVGSCAAYPKQFFVVVNDQVFQAHSALNAIDICFKCFHVFDLKYPLPSEHIWIMLEKGLYELEKSHARATLARPLQKAMKAKRSRVSQGSEAGTSN